MASLSINRAHTVSHMQVCVFLFESCRWKVDKHLPLHFRSHIAWRLPLTCIALQSIEFKCWAKQCVLLSGCASVAFAPQRWELSAFRFHFASRFGAFFSRFFFFFHFEKFYNPLSYEWVMARIRWSRVINGLRLQHNLKFFILNFCNQANGVITFIHFDGGEVFNLPKY